MIYTLVNKFKYFVIRSVIPVIFFHSDSFPKNYTEKEVADAIANTLKRTPDRKDGGGRKKEVIVEDLNQWDQDNADEEDELEEEEELLGRESDSSIDSSGSNT